MVGYVYRRAVGGCVCVVWVGRKYAELNLSDWWLENKRMRKIQTV